MKTTKNHRIGVLVHCAPTPHFHFVILKRDGKKIKAASGLGVSKAQARRNALEEAKTKGF